MKSTTVTEASIRELVDAFYTKVRKDGLLSPVFVQAIGANDDDWKGHLEQMYSFWSSIILGTGRYQGNPLQKHQALPAFDAVLFDRWLSLFAETARGLYSPDTAEHIIAKSQRIAESLKRGIYPSTGDAAAVTRP